MYLLSAQTLNQAYRRWVFLRKYAAYRAMQAEAIQFTRGMLLRKTAQIEESKREKNALLGEAVENKGAIATEVQAQSKTLEVLKGDELRLKKDLDQKKKDAAALDVAIESIIKAEVQKAIAARAERDRLAKERAARTEEEKINKPSSKPEKRNENTRNEEKITAEDSASKAFIDQKGKHEWPVKSGFIARQFGKVSHPVYKEIVIQNNGIDIRTDLDAKVTAIFGGEVVGVTFVPGHDYTVIVQHGNFYTVYANLTSSYVKKGAMIDQNTDLGRVSMNPLSGAAELHFELWMHKERLDPERWIGRE
jgi:murein hydrolase activator